MTDNSDEQIELNIAGLGMKKFTPVPKPTKVNPYVEPPTQNNFVGATPERQQRGAMDTQPFLGMERNTARNDYAPSIDPRDNNQPDYQDTKPLATIPERESLLRGNDLDGSTVMNGDGEIDFNDEDQPENYAVFEDDIAKIKKFKDEYNTAYEKDKEVDRKATVQQVKLDQLVEHSNELIDKKEEFKQALLEIMKENAKLEHRNKDLEEDIKELEDAIEKGIKLVNQDDDDERNINLFVVGDPTKLHEMKLERERRKMKRQLINALDYMEGKDTKLTGIKEHKTT